MKSIESVFQSLEKCGLVHGEIRIDNQVFIFKEKQISKSGAVGIFLKSKIFLFSSGIVILVIMVIIFVFFGRSPRSTSIIASPGEVFKAIEAIRFNVSIDEQSIPESLANKVKQMGVNKKGYIEATFFNQTEMIYIPQGEFLRGDQIGDGLPDQHPSRSIKLDGYWMQKYEVTFDQYYRFCNEIKAALPDDNDNGWNNLPVVNITRADALQYCQWLSTKSGLSFKLPSEAQWEKAARGPAGLKYPWGNSAVDGKKANLADKQYALREKSSYADQKIDDGYVYRAPPGSFPDGASPYGIMDMIGNVAEFCLDSYNEMYYEIADNRNPLFIDNDPDNMFIVIRGGSWITPPAMFRENKSYPLTAMFRSKNSKTTKNNYIGFRIIMQNTK